MATFTVHHAKTNLSKLIADSLRGEEVVIAKNRTPVVRLVPIDGAPPRRAGRLKGRIALTQAFFEPLTDDQFDAWAGETGP